MFRSGTTLLARMFNAHPGISFASDPYLSFFKFFRSDVATGEGISAKTDSALDDYYFSIAGSRLLKSIRSASLDLGFDKRQLDHLRQAVRKTGTPYSPLIMDMLDSIRGGSYDAILSSMLDLLRRGYGKPGAIMLGFKTVWANEFIPAVSRNYPNARFIQIVRDPRAVCASKNVGKARYPWLFMARQWRKLAALSWLHGHDAILQGKVMTVRYEDLVAAPEVTAKSMCEFLNVDFSEHMIDARQYVDGAGESWRQNTSYGGGKTAFDQVAIGRWRDVLTADETAHIEMLCYPEMLLHGYAPTGIPQWRNEYVLSPVRVPDAQLAEWIRHEYPNDVLSVSMQVAMEAIRYRLLILPQDVLRQSMEELLEGCFLHRDVIERAADEHRKKCC
jgi:hypothetical protein